MHVLFALYYDVGILGEGTIIEKVHNIKSRRKRPLEQETYSPKANMGDQRLRFFLHIIPQVRNVGVF